MPYPNEHSCRLEEPDQFIRIRPEERKHNGKIYRVLYGFLKDGGSKEQAYRYPKDIWTAGDARIHCKDHGGSFEAASSQTQEMETSDRSWADIDKSKLPKECFLWVEDPEKKATWHLPYREGTGGIDPKTGMYREAGPVNLQALRSALAAIGGARTGKPMQIPAEVRKKIESLAERLKIGRKNQEMRYADPTLNPWIKTDEEEI